LNDGKIQLDRIDKFLNDLQTSLKPRVEKVSLLSTLPLPLPVPVPKPEDVEDVVTNQLSIIPPDPDEIPISPSSMINTAIPSLLPIDAGTTAKSTGFTLHSNQPTTALHEELSLQLEQMARQLKRNAIHFSTSLGNDRAVVEDAEVKIEKNYDVLQGQRMKLRDRTSGGWKNTCLVVGIVVVVLVGFLLVVMIIRVT